MASIRKERTIGEDRLVTFFNGAVARERLIADVLPNEMAEITGELMERGIETVKHSLEASAEAA